MRNVPPGIQTIPTLRARFGVGFWNDAIVPPSAHTRAQRAAAFDFKAEGALAIALRSAAGRNRRLLYGF
jgi:hypothetical protein